MVVGKIMWFSCSQVSLRIENDLAKIIIPAIPSTGALSDLEILVILLEDRRFFGHRGIDIYSIVREIFKLCTFQRFGGASTLDMQFVRMRTGYKDRSLRRKSYEMLLAYLLQSRMDKMQILRAYLQGVYLGSGIYGIESGARKMFNKRSYQLTMEQAALLAAMMVYPRPSNPSSRWEARAKQRAAYGLKLFDELGQQYKQHFE